MLPSQPLGNRGCETQEVQKIKYFIKGIPRYRPQMGLKDSIFWKKLSGKVTWINVVIFRGYYGKEVIFSQKQSLQSFLLLMPWIAPIMPQTHCFATITPKPGYLDSIETFHEKILILFSGGS